EHLGELKNERRTIIFYEAPHKLCRTLEDLYNAFGERKIAIARELTKLHEQVLSTTLSGACEYFKENAPRGEFVLIVEGASAAEQRVYTVDEAVSLARALQEDGLSASAAAKEAANISGIKKGDIYKQMLEK
ncbi:MAG: 16S rRNA (cytidine(1402)-2'-O)-methyltransferase, partial [Clostridia bacterium]|nr:16S rRNA (cytidine(1402)-2'-O)-methyltransferase [Clostridia bacterium]